MYYLKKAVCLIAVLAVTMQLTACGGEEKKKEVKVQDAVSIENGTLTNESKVIAVGDDTVTYGEYLTYNIFARKNFENVYTEALWDCQVDGTTIGQHAVEDVVRMIIQVKVLGKMAEEKGIKIEIDEKEDIDYKADQYLEKLSDDEKVKNNITKEVARKIFEENELAGKMYDVITSSAAGEESLEKYKASEILALHFPANDSNREDVKNQANAAVQELNNYKGNFYSFVKDKTSNAPVEEIVGNKDSRQNLAQTALNLGAGKKSGVIEESDGFYVIYVLKSNVKSINKKYMEQYTKEQQTKAFQDEYSAQAQRFGVKVSKSLLAKKE